LTVRAGLRRAPNLAATIIDPPVRVFVAVAVAIVLAFRGVYAQFGIPSVPVTVAIEAQGAARQGLINQQVCVIVNTRKAGVEALRTDREKVPGARTGTSIFRRIAYAISIVIIWRADYHFTEVRRGKNDVCPVRIGQLVYKDFDRGKATGCTGLKRDSPQLEGASCETAGGFAPEANRPWSRYIAVAGGV
jgi:hypothetical protein